MTMDLLFSLDPNRASQPGGITLRQWIQMHGPGTGAVSEITPSVVLAYVQLAIPLAVKLTECFLDGQGASQQHPIPLASIAMANVMLERKEADHSAEDVIHPSEDEVSLGGGIGQGGDWKELASDWENFVSLLNTVDEQSLANYSDAATRRNSVTPGLEDYSTIDAVTIVPQAGGAPLMGDAMSRLHALGTLLFELFSGNIPMTGKEAMYPSRAHGGSTTSETTLHSISLSRESHDLRHDSSVPERSTKRNHTGPASPRLGGADTYSNLLDQLGFWGIPQSICALIDNLLDCSNGDFARDETYRSFVDVHSDLQLMINDPNRFLLDVDVSKPNFSICNKLYGRDADISKVQEAYQQRLDKCRGIVIKGEPGVGKSRLAMHVQTLTNEVNGYFLRGKFDQNQHVKPLAVIGSTFDECCKMFQKQGNSQQKHEFSKALKSALGNHCSTLARILPSLLNLLSLPSNLHDANECFDPDARGIRYLLCTFVELFSFHLSRPMTLFLDDLQWADTSSLLFIRGLLSEPKIGKHLFFVCCFRDKESTSDDNNLSTWYRSISDFPMLKIDLGNLDVERVNNFLSDALRLSPRITRPLSSTLHRKTRGNPLFLTRMLESLRQDGHLHFSLQARRWKWNMDKINDLTLADDVVELLTKEMRNLPNNLQLGLKVAACMGAVFPKDLVDTLSKDVGVDLQDALREVSVKGFMDDAGTNYRFAHDRIQQAAYEIMSKKQREINHLRFGLAICARSLNENQGDDMFFIAVNQINRGGPQPSLDSRKKDMIATLNLKAGKRCVILSDFHSALKFFKHGISFLSEDHWKNQYDLSLELFDASAEAACVVSNSAATNSYSENVLNHARCLEDKLNTQYANVRALLHAASFQEAKRLAFDVLSQLGENTPRRLDDNQLLAKIEKVNNMICNMPSESILHLKQMQKKKTTTLMKLYSILFHVLFTSDPLRMGEVSLRMVELTLSEGLCANAPCGFAFFGMTLMSIGKPANAYRVGTIALRLLDKLKEKGLGHGKTSNVVFVVHQFISWTAEPFQSIPDAHLLGHVAGKQSGDAMSSMLNYQFYLMASFVSGKSLVVINKESRKFLEELVSQNQMLTLNYAISLHLQTVAMIEGLKADGTYSFGRLPRMSEIFEIAYAAENGDLLVSVLVYQLMRTFFYRRYDDMLYNTNILERISESKYPLKMFFVLGIFFEGLVAYNMARRTKEKKWIVKGDAALSEIKWWSQFSSWNFANKVALLESEKMYSSGMFHQASELYEKSIKLAHDHKFVQEEAMSCELAGIFYYERSHRQKSYELLNRACDNYRKWGAKAVVVRVEQFMQTEFNFNSLPFSRGVSF